MSDVITVPSHTKKDNPKAALKPCVHTFSDATGSLHPQSRWPETVCSLARIRTSLITTRAHCAAHSGRYQRPA
jgi:hypothetical protein